MHVKSRRIGAQKMVVNSGDIETAVNELGHYRLDLGFEQDEIAHNHGLAAHPLKCDPATERQSRLNAHAVDRDVKVAARKAIAMNLAGDHGRLSADRLVNFLPVNSLTLCGRCRGQASSNEKRIRKSHHLLRLGLVPVVRPSPRSVANRTDCPGRSFPQWFQASLVIL